MQVNIPICNQCAIKGRLSLGVAEYTEYDNDLKVLHCCITHLIEIKEKYSYYWLLNKTLINYLK
jgi:hypothetical protein